MAETHINAYVAELESAIQDLNRAQARVDELQSIVDAATVVEEPTTEAVVSNKTKSSKKKGK